MPEAFKNLISPELVTCLARHLDRHLTSSASPSFANAVLPELGKLELKARVQLIADEMFKVLPVDTRQRNDILRAMLHPDTRSETLVRESDEQGIAGWGIWPLSLIVGQHGLDEFDASMDLLREMTLRSTSEFAIRHFLLADQARALQIMEGWLDDPNEHARRLVSEGSRPRLPWGMKLQALCKDPTPTLVLLEGLKDDPSEYVRRSVANHLNDISRDNPAVAIRMARRWMKQADRNRTALIRHGCRTLIKAGHPDILTLFGYETPRLEHRPLILSRQQLSLGESLQLSTELISTAATPQKLIIDYSVFHRLANGKRSAKVFKGGTVTLNPGQSLSFSRTHTFRPVTTRRYHAGTHAIALRINGVDTDEVNFEFVL
ncbi:hypothetical protein ACUNV4_15090 [Granulosicoccus sp. 3-233]|uniref:hypothetical protein n=1 Tax=Granulosicoccus sp. 3-233 TaxID=3417969 RepID=UPI003D359558